MGFTKINIILISFLSFLIIKSIIFHNIRSKKITFLIQNISKLSFGIYLVHYVVINNLRDGNLGFAIHKINGEFMHPVAGIFITFIATFAISVLIVFFLKRLPYIKTIVP